MDSRNTQTQRFSIEKLEERIAPAAGAMGLEIAAGHFPTNENIPEDVGLPETPCPERGGRP